MKQVLLTHSFALSLPVLSSIRQYLQRQITLLDIPPSTGQSLELVTTEHLTNLFRHHDTPATTVSLQFYRYQQQLYFEITDNGDGWVDMQQRLDDASLPTEIATGGMGLALICTLLPNYEYDYKPGRNRFTFLLPNELSQPTILIIDDSPSQLALLRTFLKQDYQVTAFSSAEEALNWLHDNQCDLVVTDLHMPGMSGFEFRHIVGNLPQHALLPFIFLTGDDLPTTRNLAATQAIDDFLIKPVKKAFLNNTLSRILARHEHLEELYEQKLLSGLAPQLSSAPQSTPNRDWSVCYDNQPKLSGDFCLSNSPSQPKAFQSTASQKMAPQLIVMGDQMGHGPLARANGAAWLGFIQGLLTRTDMTGSKLIGILNNELYRASQLQPHLMCLLVIEISCDGQFEVINAGMPPLIVCRLSTESHNENLSGNSHHKLKTETLTDSVGLLGIDPELTTTPIIGQLQSGESIHCFSDGIIEDSHALIDIHWPSVLSLKHELIWSFSQQEHCDDKSLLSIGFDNI